MSDRFDKVLQKVEESVTHMSKALTVFEKGTVDLKAKFSEELTDFQGKSEKGVESLRWQLDTLIKAFVLQLDALVVDFEKRLSKSSDVALEAFSGEVRNRFETIYAAHEQEVKKGMEDIFEKDLEVLFNKYGDRLAPVILKILIRHIFRIKRK
jgi:hypothetical protein